MLYERRTLYSDRPSPSTITISPRALRRTLLSGLLITGFSMAEFAYVLPITSQAIHPWIEYTITSLTYGLSILLWFRLILIDPGRLPRSCPRGFQLDNAESDTEAPARPRTGVIFQAAGIVFETSTCAVCSLTLPPETDHCEETDECVVALDHYCPWVGLPIGLRNMLPFVVSLSVLCIHSVWCFSLATVALIHANNINEIGIAGACLLGSFFGGAFTGGMCGWTLYDIFRDKSPRLYSLCNQQSKKKINDSKSTDADQCLSNLVESLNNSIKNKMKWLKHTGLRRLIFGSYMPVLYCLPPEQAEQQAWAWTIVLCGTSQL